ncbi:hypothetical protein ACFOWM_00775 [Ferruginibacter yonginensis]|uniref:Uncharacterized protein n=1 Tax=Ferruginibacter yonginensis TaxID=1310416 RepID=A0ABV8QM68_9BACT
MKSFITQLKNVNEPLFYFGCICACSAVLFLILTQITHVKVLQVNAWYKPFKFAVSIAIYVFTMAWYIQYLPQFNTKLFSWSVIVLLGFEIVYIAIQAARGQQSHFNISNGWYSLLYVLMAVAASLVSLYTAFIAWLFFVAPLYDLPSYYLWAIRLALLLFVIFSFQGFLMGSRLSHTIGGADGSEGIAILNWSKTLGDARVAHFIGMHALQVLPLLAYYVLRNTYLTFIMAILYAALAFFTLIQALQGKPFIK